MKNSPDDRKEREYLDTCLKAELRRLSPEQIRQVADFVESLRSENAAIDLDLHPL